MSDEHKVIVHIGDDIEEYTDVDNVDFEDDSVYVYKDFDKGLLHAVYGPGCWSKVTFP